MGAVADAPFPVADPFTDAMESHRRELTGYCYRMLGAGSEAEDAVQETFLRAWRAREKFERRSTLRSWLYTIATNVCLDMPGKPQRRARPMDLVSPSTTESAVLGLRSDDTWVQPISDDRALPDVADPAEMAGLRESIRLAFVAALQHLPPRQRAVLILREVLHWQAAEVAELLGSSVASVNSALQRARSTLDGLSLKSDEAGLDTDDEVLLQEYVSAFEAYDIERFVKLLRDDVAFSMPPHALWIRGPQEVSRWMLGPGIGCRGSRLIALHANGCPAFASYKPSPEGGWAPWSIQVVEIKAGELTAIHNYLNTGLFESFGLPARLEPEPPAGA
ncbi:MAG TPA: sigma-70 family RNA polymerase sigma factor [Solirubrobacteraceae bacterium]|nr:sigma-70 family RNA polymerase sigma factor [Solirubrobacteraceae bacterium]